MIDRTLNNETEPLPRNCISDEFERQRKSNKLSFNPTMTSTHLCASPKFPKEKLVKNARNGFSKFSRSTVTPHDHKRRTTEALVHHHAEPQSTHSRSMIIPSSRRSPLTISSSSLSWGPYGTRGQSYVPAACPSFIISDSRSNIDSSSARGPTS